MMMQQRSPDSLEYSAPSTAPASEGVVAYSSDISHMHELVAAIASDAGVRTMVLSHLSPAMDQDGVRERVLAEMGTIFRGVLIWGEDLMEIPAGEP